MGRQWLHSKKEVNANKRAKITSKLVREIMVAAKMGVPDPAMNPRLSLAVDAARKQSVSNDVITRAIKKGSGEGSEGVNYELVTYEGMAPHNVPVIVECLTENRNRTISEVRRAFTRAGTSLGEPGSVAWQFTEKGYFVINRQDEDGAAVAVDPDEVFMVALEAGADDVDVSDDVIEVYTDRANFAAVSQALDAAGLKAAQAELIMQPNSPLALGGEEAVAVLDLVEALEELDDVNKVYHNLELTDEMVAQFA